MDAVELLKSWPGWSNAGAETVLASPAWRLPVRLGDQPAVLRFGREPLAETIDLKITLDDEPHVLSLADSPRYPDLHLLWSRRTGLPPEVLLALLEKECGAVFALVEAATRRLLGVKGLAPAPAADAARLEVETAGGTFAVALDLPPEVRTAWGRLENLDPAHPSIRGLTRPARVDYAAFDLAAEDRAALAAGDHLLVPDAAAAQPCWTVDAPADDRVHACAVDETAIAFGAFADGALPPIPEPRALTLFFKGRPLATGVPATVGSARSVQIVHGLPD